MKPSTRFTIALVLVLVAAVLLLLVNQNVITAAATPTPTARPPFLGDISAADITRVRITDNKNKTSFAAEVDPQAGWKITEAPKDKDTGLGVDSAKLGNAVDVLPSVIPVSVISASDPSNDPKAYGLDAPAYTLVLTIKGQPLAIQLGALNLDQSEYYTYKGDSKDVYLVSNYNFSPFIDFITNPPYVQPTPNLTITATATATPTATPTPTAAATETPTLAVTPTP